MKLAIKVSCIFLLNIQSVDRCMNSLLVNYSEVAALIFFHANLRHGIDV